MNRVARRAGIVLVLVAALVAGLAFFVVEYVACASDWVIFQGSPHVYSGGNIGCGAVVDADGVLLLDMNNGRTYSQSEAIRMSTVHLLGDRYGSISAPALPTYAAQLAGYNIVGGVYSYNGTGGVAELTVSSQVQTAALEAMSGRKGTIGVYNYKTGQLICSVTTPTYDPDHVPETETDPNGIYEGMYVNRFTQSLYIPGSIFKIVTLAAALETIPDIQDQVFICKGEYEIGADKVICDGTHWEQDLKTAFRNSCNCAFAQIAQQLGGETLQRFVSEFGVLEPVSFDGITTVPGNVELDNAAQVNVAWGSIGQYTDQINPCAFMTFMGAVAAQGKGVKPYLVEKVSSGGFASYSASTQKCGRIMSNKTAKVLQEYMSFNVTDKYGSDNFPGLNVCAKTGTGEVGGGRKPNAMIAGFVSDDAYPFAFIVAVEDGGYGSEVCVPILSKVLAACKSAYDG